MKQFILVDEKGEILPFTVTDSEIVDPGLIDRQIVHYGNYDPFVRYSIAFEDTIPAMGYKAYLVVESGQELKQNRDQKKENQVMENSWYKILVEKMEHLR